MAPSLKPAYVSPDAICANCSRIQKDLKPAFKLKKCGACKTTLYCSENCQLASYGKHKPECKIIKSGVVAEKERKAALELQELSSRMNDLNVGTPMETPSVPAIIDLPPDLEPASFSSDEIITNTAVSNPRKWTASAPIIPPPDNKAAAARKLAETRYTSEVTFYLEHTPCTETITTQLLSGMNPPNTYLSSLPEKRVLKELIDCFRLRLEDQYTFNQNYLGVYAGGSNLGLWSKYIALLVDSGVLPPWWNSEKRDELERLAMDQKGEEWIEKAMKRIEIVERYNGERSIPLRLRELCGMIFDQPMTGKWSDSVSFIPATSMDIRNPIEDRKPKAKTSYTGITPSGIDGMAYYDPLAMIQADQAYKAQAVAYLQSEPLPKLDIQEFLLVSQKFPPNAYLSALDTELDVMHQLIDTFRLRMEDHYVWNMENIGVYGGGSNQRFWNEFMDLAQENKVVPDWWNNKKRRILDILAKDENGDYCVEHPVERDDIIRDYGGDIVMPLKLRGVGERVYGKPVSDMC